MPVSKVVDRKANFAAIDSKIADKISDTVQVLTREKKLTWKRQYMINYVS